MPLDGNGIWQYEETESVAPFSEFMNRLAGSTSTRVGELDAAIPTDTGWMPFAADAPYTASPDVAAIKFGPFVAWRGWIDPDGDWGAANSHHDLITGLPPELVPATSLAVTAASRSTVAPGPFRLVINSNGSLQVRCEIANHTGGVYLGNLVYAV